MLPNFICVGPGRSGTSWLYEVLLEHPEVCMARDIKETNFFNYDYEKGIEWYEKYFNHCKYGNAIGEISNIYINKPCLAEKIAKNIPNCKIIICLRNPYERIQSVYSYHLRNGTIKCDFDEAIDKLPEIIYENCYYKLIKPYFNNFPKNNIFFMHYEYLKNDPLYLCKSLFNFIGVDDSFIPTKMNKKINKSIIPKNILYRYLIRQSGDFLRKYRLLKILTWAKKSDIIKALFFKEYNYKLHNLMTPDAKTKIDNYFVNDIAKLEKMLNLNLKEWKI